MTEKLGNETIRRKQKLTSERGVEYWSVNMIWETECRKIKTEERQPSWNDFWRGMKSSRLKRFLLFSLYDFQIKVIVFQTARATIIPSKIYLV